MRFKNYSFFSLLNLNLFLLKHTSYFSLFVRCYFFLLQFVFLRPHFRCCCCFGVVVGGCAACCRPVMLLFVGGAFFHKQIFCTFTFFPYYPDRRTTPRERSLTWTLINTNTRRHTHNFYYYAFFQQNTKLWRIKEESLQSSLSFIFFSFFCLNRNGILAKDYFFLMK